MVTVSHLVKVILEDNPFVLEGLSRGIISHGNLADELKPRIEKKLKRKVKDAAIVMALRRYADEIRKKELPKKKFNFSGELMIKTNICNFNVLKNPDLVEKIRSLYKMIKVRRGELLNIIVGNNEVSVVASQKYEREIVGFLENEKMLNKESDLVAITILFSEDFVHAPGAVFHVLRKIAWENINIYEIVSTLTELTLIIKNKDSMRAYEVLQEIIK